MSKQDNPVALFVAFAVTAGLVVAGLTVFGVSLPFFPTRSSSPSVGRSTDNKDLQTLTILGDSFSGYSTFRHPDFQTTLEQVGIDINYETEVNRTKRADRLGQDADIWLTTLDRFLIGQPEGKIVGIVDRTVGGDGVVLNTLRYPNLKSLPDLQTLVEAEAKKGNKLSVAYTADSPSEYIGLVLDTKFEGFNLSDLNLIETNDASEALNLLNSAGENVAVAILWEPFVTQAQRQGHTLVLSSEDAPKSILDVIVASDRLIETQPAMLSDFLEAYYRRIDTNVRDASALQAQIAEDGDLSAEDAALVLQGIEFFTAPQSRQWMADDTLKTRISATAAVLALSGRLDSVPDNPANLYTVEPIAIAAENTQTLIDLVRADNPELADRLAGQSRAISPTVTPVSAQAVKDAPTVGNLDVRGEVKFETGSAEIAPEGIATLDNLAAEIREFNPNTIAVRAIGHTSKTGPADVNQQLSEQRAQAVVNYLKGLGLSHNFVAEGKGFSTPLSDISPEDPRQQRTEIRLVRIN